MSCEKTLDRIRNFIGERFPDVEVHAEPGLDPFQGRTTGPLADAVREAYRFGFGEQAVFTREGGSIGAVPTMQRVLQAPVFFLGLSLPEHGYHAPNEFFDWEQAEGGSAAFEYFFSACVALSKRQPLSTA
jgi:acetylornithine deacetylase/succinyl-diaminopimelate desuccinylase-like protein